MSTDRHNVGCKWQMPYGDRTKDWKPEDWERFLYYHIKKLNEQYLATLLWEGKFRTVKQENNAMRRRYEAALRENEELKMSSKQLVLQHIESHGRLAESLEERE